MMNSIDCWKTIATFVLFLCGLCWVTFLSITKIDEDKIMRETVQEIKKDIQMIKEAMGIEDEQS